MPANGDKDQSLLEEMVRIVRLTRAGSDHTWLPGESYRRKITADNQAAGVLATEASQIIDRTDATEFPAQLAGSA